MTSMTPEARRARIAELQTELDQLRSEELAEYIADPRNRAELARKWWEELRVGLAITLEDFEQLLDECRELKQTSAAAACARLRDRLELPMPVASKYIRLL